MGTISVDWIFWGHEDHIFTMYYLRMQYIEFRPGIMVLQAR